MQERPRCMKCQTIIEWDMVFEAPCGHDECVSAVFHPICLMEWREHREKIMRRYPKIAFVLFDRGGD